MKIAIDSALAPIVTRLFEWYFAERSDAQGARDGRALPQERREGAGEHGSHNPAQPPLYWLVRMERHWQTGREAKSRSRHKVRNGQKFSVH